MFASPLPAGFYTHFHVTDDEVIAELHAALGWSGDAHACSEALARDLIAAIRAQDDGSSWLDALLREYRLSTQEGTALMCLAEAILRIPDRATVDRLLADKIAASDWERHLHDGQSSFFVNAGTWGLLLSGKLLRVEEQTGKSLTAALQRVLARGGEPLVRQAVGAAVRLLGRKFIVGRTIGNALVQSRELVARGYRFSYDMLGEGAKTLADAQRYCGAYARALAATGKEAKGRGPIAGPGISVKLSALHPRYEWAQRERVHAQLVPSLSELARLAKQYDVGLTIDAEEADRLELSLEVFAALCGDASLAGWDGLGLAVQAYQKRALDVVRWVIANARANGRRIMLRLVKGAYWDTEIKRAQERGLAGYPVFTRKPATDLSYLACAQEMLHATDALYPQFATHNAHTAAAILTLAEDKPFELQKLFGMGDALHDEIARRSKGKVSTRVYAPVGGYQDLLPYLVRRLLENGANSSFVNQLSDPAIAIDDLVADPVALIDAARPKANPKIPLPRDLYGGARRNAASLDLTNLRDLARIAAGLSEADATRWSASPIVSGKAISGDAQPVTNPANRQQVVGQVIEARPEDIESALVAAQQAWNAWNATEPETRAQCLERAADRLEAQMPLLLALVIREAGKTIADALSEVREAIDYCRYYAGEARRLFAAPIVLPGPTGERNCLQLAGRGVFACVSPWNFPLAIFTGQVTAALAAGNAVIAKPAEQTPLIAAAAVRILHEAGVPPEVLHLLPGQGETVGAALTRDARIAGIAFTGGTDTARAIAKALADRPGALIPLIAETGGLNAMIVDSSALHEQVTGDVLLSAFGAAGQRCSSLRLLFLQDNIATRVIDMIAGATAELRVGDPANLATDVGPVIDKGALDILHRHDRRMRREARLLAAAPLRPECTAGSFFAPCAFELNAAAQLTQEVFGPILHVLRYRADDLELVVDAVNATGYGLTFGIHSRIDSTIARITQRIRAGNVYVNRSMIGAIVGVQPFGGEGLSGTGPKAGGPHYLLRFASEKAVSVNTTAAGGNATLLSLS